MRAPISIVIPTLDAMDELPEALDALIEGVEAGLIRDLVLSDGGSTDRISRFAEEMGAVLVEGPKGRGGQLMRGAAAAEGEWLLFLHADTCLSAGWTRAVLAHLRDRPDRAGWFRLGFRAEGFAPWLVAGWANLRASLGLPYGDQGLLVGRELYDEVGSYPDQPLMEDVEIARRLRGRLAPLAATAWTSAARYQRQGWLRRGGRNLVTVVRYRLGADPARLAERYARD